MFRTYLSLRYLLARRTNLIGVIGILVGTGALIMILSIMTGFLDQNRSVVRGSLADIIIEPSFHYMRPTAPVRRRPGLILSRLAQMPGVAAATPQLVWGGILTQSGRMEQTARLMSDPTHGSLLAVQLVGIDVRTDERLAGLALRASLLARGLPAPRLPLQDEFDTTDLLPALLRGRSSGTGAEAGGGATAEEDPGPSRRRQRRAPVANPLFPFGVPPGHRPRGRLLARALVGQQLFHQLDLRVNDTIEISTAVPDSKSGEWTPNNRRFLVAGTFQSQDNELDGSRIYLERGELADFLGGDRPYSQILVRLADFDADGERLQEEILDGLTAAGLLVGDPIEVRTWEQFRVNLLSAIENERVLMGIMLSLVLIVAGFTVFAILSMMVIEKRRDIGILCALGATPTGILDVFLLIAFWDALIGSVLGAVAGVWLAVRIDPLERWLSETLGYQIFNRDVYLFNHIPSRVDPVAVAIIVAGAFLCTLLFAAVPAWRAARLDPLEALRYE